MANNIKNEFKDFISTLSTEICKEVLVEELEKVNTSLDNTSNKYNELYGNYKITIEQIKQELNKLDSATKNMNSFTKSIDTNSKAVNESLVMIKDVQGKVLNNILSKNEKALEKYKTDIQKLNLQERNEFIRELEKNLNKGSKEYLKQLSSIVNGSKVNETLSNTSETKVYMQDVITKMNILKNDIDVLKNNVSKSQSEDEKNINNILYDMHILERKFEEMQSINKILNKNFLQLQEEVIMKNKVIIGMNIGILIMAFICMIK